MILKAILCFEKLQLLKREFFPSGFLFLDIKQFLSEMSKAPPSFSKI